MVTVEVGKKYKCRDGTWVEMTVHDIYTSSCYCYGGIWHSSTLGNFSLMDCWDSSGYNKTLKDLDLVAYYEEDDNLWGSYKSSYVSEFDPNVQPKCYCPRDLVCTDERSKCNHYENCEYYKWKKKKDKYDQDKRDEEDKKRTLD